jgi:hypothetical protein
MELSTEEQKTQLEVGWRLGIGLGNWKFDLDQEESRNLGSVSLGAMGRTNSEG